MITRSPVGNSGGTGIKEGSILATSANSFRLRITSIQLVIRPNKNVVLDPPDSFDLIVPWGDFARQPIFENVARARVTSTPMVTWFRFMPASDYIREQGQIHGFVAGQKFGIFL